MTKFLESRAMLKLNYFIKRGNNFFREEGAPLERLSSQKKFVAEQNYETFFICNESSSTGVSLPNILTSTLIFPLS